MRICTIRKMFCGVVAAVMVVSLSSCGYFSQFKNRDNAMKLRVGMTKQEVLDIMGEPLRDEEYNKPDLWFYYIDTRWGFDCQMTRDECLPVVFKDGKVAGFGVEYYKEHVEYPATTGKK